MFGCGDSTYQSTSTTPAVCSNVDRTVCASASRRVGIGPVDLRDERLQHRRTRRHLDHLDRRAEASRERIEPGPQPFGDGVALLAAFVLRHERHLQVGEIRLRAAGSSGARAR